jgi:hypothetical protein
MSDRVKIILAVILFISALLLPLVGMAVGWYKWDVQTGLLIMVAVFVVLFLLAAILLVRVKELNWLTVSLPYVFGALYTALPDFIPFSVDDAAATTAGAIFSFILALRKNENTPKWIFLPLLLAAIYTLVGGTIPGPIDEVLVDVLALLIAGVGVNRGTGRELATEDE